MSAFDESVLFCRDTRNDEGIVRFQTMQGGHKFIVDNLPRFSAIMVFWSGSDKPRKKSSLPLLVNTAIRRVADLITPRGYLIWLVWNHIGYVSWRYSRLDEIMTTVDLDGWPIPDHMAVSIIRRYGAYEYCRYFRYAGENVFEVYWVVLKRDGRILIVESTDSWIGKWGHLLDVNWR